MSITETSQNLVKIPALSVIEFLQTAIIFGLFGLSVLWIKAEKRGNVHEFTLYGKGLSKDGLVRRIQRVVPA